MAVEILTALNIQKGNVTSITLNIDAGKIPELTIKRVVSSAEDAEKISEIIERYELNQAVK